MQLYSRVLATQQTVNRFQYADFSWGTNDCVQLAAFHLRQLGYDDPLADVAPYATFRNAKKALKAAGLDKIEDWLDARFERIAPASALDGDLLALPGDERTGMTALAVHVGHERVLAFVENPENGWTKGLVGRAVEAALYGWRIPPAVTHKPLTEAPPSARWPTVGGA